MDNFVGRKWTRADVDAAEAFYKTHNAGYTPYPFPRDLFNKFIAENDGYFPVVIEALPEGTVAYTHTPVFIITAEDEYSRLVTFMETILTMVSSASSRPWFPFDWSSFSWNGQMSRKWILRIWSSKSMHLRRFRWTM